MPVAGPSDNQENASLCYDEVINILTHKYHIDITSKNSFFPNDYTKKEKEKALEDLKKSIYIIFKMDSWEGW